MDISAQSSLKMLWSTDEETGLTTITYKDPSDVVLGDIVIESVKLRSFLEGCAEIAQSIFPSTLDTVNRVGHRTTFAQDTGLGEMTFE